MLVLFDNGTPRTLARYLIDHHTVTEARARGCEELENGELLARAEAGGFELLLTTDRGFGISRTLRVENCDRRIGTRTLVPDQATCGASSRSSERSQARQL